MHHQILGTAQNLLHSYSVPISFWEEFVLTVVYLINHTLSSVLCIDTSFEKCFIQNWIIQNFLSLVLHALSNYHIMNKPNSHHNVCIFLGYGIEHKKDINAKILNKSHSYIKACDLFRTHSIFLPSSFSTSPEQPSLTPTDPFPYLFPYTTSSAPQDSTTTSLSTSPEKPL